MATDEGVRWVRAYGLASHPNILGGVLAFGLLVIASAQGDGRWTRLIRMAVFGLGVAGLFLTFSRAAWIAFAPPCSTLPSRASRSRASRASAR